MAFTGKFTTIGTVPTWDGEKFVSKSIAELGAADIHASYIVMSATSSLADERILSGGLGIGFSDGGAGQPLILSASIVGGTNITVDSLGNSIRINAIADISSGADPNANFILVGNTSSLNNERSLTAGTGISASDGGAGGNYTLSANLLAGNNITINTVGNALAISASAGNAGADPSASYVVISATSSLANERVLATGLGLGFSDGGSNSNVTLSASILAGPGIVVGSQGNSITVSSSLTTFDSSASYVVIANTSSLANERVLATGLGLGFADGGAGNNVTLSASIIGGTGITVDSVGNSIRVNSSQTTFDPDPSFLVLGATSSLNNERVFTPGLGLGYTDSGAGNNLTLSASIVAGAGITVDSVNNSIRVAATVTTFDPDPSYVVLGATSSLNNERVLATGLGLGYTDSGSGNNVTLSASIVAGPGVSIDSVGNSIRVNNTQTTFDPSASYVVLGATASLANERVLATGLGLGFTDGGANGNVTVSASIIAGPGIVVGTQGNSITVSSSLTTFDPDPTYLVLGATSSLNNERVFTPGVGLGYTDAGAGGALTLSASVVAGDGISVDTVGNSIRVNNTQTTFDSSASYVVLGATSSLANERILSTGLGLGFTDAGAGNALTISASVIAGPGIVVGTQGNSITVSSSLTTFDNSASYVVLGLTNSLGNERLLTPGVGIGFNDVGPGAALTVSAALVAGPGITLGTQGNFIAVSSSLTTFDNSASYVVLGLTSSLANERVFTPGLGLGFNDDNIGGTLTVSASIKAGPGIVVGTEGNSIAVSSSLTTFDNSASYVVLGITNSLANERVLTPGLGLGYTDSGPAGALTLSASIIGGTNVTVDSVGNSIRINSTAGGGSTQFVEGTPSPRLRTTASLAIGTDAVFAEDIGSNVVLFVSGTALTNAKSAVFGGRVVISGNLSLGNTVIADTISGSIVGGSNNTLRAPSIFGFIGGGSDNDLNSARATIVAGTSNTVTASNESAIVAGTLNRVSASLRSFIGSGDSNIIGGTATRGFIGAGTGNIISSSIDAFLGGGNTNVISASALNGVLVGGTNNRLGFSNYSVLVGGQGNLLEGSNQATIAGGVSNSVTASIYGIVVGGNTNSVFSSGYGTVLGGFTNTIRSSQYSTILGGLSSLISSSQTSKIFGSSNQIVGSDTSVIAGGVNNIMTLNRADSSNARAGNVIGGGSGNELTTLGSFMTIAGGSTNKITAGESTTAGVIAGNGALIAGGTNNTIIVRSSTAQTDGPSSILGGSNNTVMMTNLGTGSLIAGGIRNFISYSNSSLSTSALKGNFIAGGFDNAISGNVVAANNASFNSIGGGTNNEIANMTYNVIGGGNTNIIWSDAGSAAFGRHFIGGGEFNKIEPGASGSVIVGGGRNYISGAATANQQAAGSFIGGGFSNRILANISFSSGSFIGGGINNNLSAQIGGVIVGGANNIVSGNAGANGFGLHNIIVGGQTNVISSSSTTAGTHLYNFIGGGNTNTINLGSYGTIVNGLQNTINSVTFTAGFSQGQFIGGGTFNQIIGTRTSGSAIVGGTLNTISASSIGTFGGNLIGGGEANSILSDAGSSPQYSVIVGGSGSVVRNQYNSVLVGGELNSITHESLIGAGGRNFIGGGSNNRIIIYGSGSVIVGGTSNTISGASALQNRSAVSFIGGGQRNTIVTNVSNMQFNTVVGGRDNDINASDGGFIGGGRNNFLSGSAGLNASVVVGGESNEIYFADYSAILVGSGNVINPVNDTRTDNNYMLIGGGRGNSIRGGGLSGSVIVGGNLNSITSSLVSAISVAGFIGTGNSNQIINGFGSTGYNSILNGESNSIRNGDQSVILGGTGHIISSSGGTTTNHVILNGTQNIISESNSANGGDYHNIFNGIQNKIVARTIRSDGNTIINGSSNEITDCNSCIIVGGGISNVLSASTKVVHIGDSSTVTSITGPALTLFAGLYVNTRTANPSSINAGDFHFEASSNTTLPSLTANQAGRIISVANSSAGAITINSFSVAAGVGSLWLWTGTTWRRISGA